MVEDANNNIKGGQGGINICGVRGEQDRERIVTHLDRRGKGREDVEVEEGDIAMMTTSGRGNGQHVLGRWHDGDQGEKRLEELDKTKEIDEVEEPEEKGRKKMEF